MTSSFEPAFTPPAEPPLNFDPPTPTPAEPVIGEHVPETYRLQFHGKAGEYFGIWMVNLALTLLTLGIYSAWAKVRTQKYFYGHTELAGSHFDYHGKPLAILIGRLIAAALFIPYAVLAQMENALAFVVLGVIVLLAPWLVARSLRFRMRMTSWRAIRFGWSGSVGQTYLHFLLMPLLIPLSLMFAMPWVHHQQRAFLLKHLRYGSTSTSVKPAVGEFYMAYLVSIGSVFAGGTALMIAFALIAAVVGVVFYVAVGNFDGSDVAKMVGGGMFIAAIAVLYLITLLLYGKRPVPPPSAAVTQPPNSGI